MVINTAARGKIPHTLPKYLDKWDWIKKDNGLENKRVWYSWFLHYLQLYSSSAKKLRKTICKKDTTPQDDFDEVPSLDANASQKCHAEELAVSSTDTNNWFVSCTVCKTLSSQTDSEGLFLKIF